MTLLEALVLGVVEGITEYLPVSSTGHLILVSSLLGLSDRVDKDTVDAFNIVIQGGAILAVLGLYRRRVAQMVRGVLGRDPVGLRLAINVLVALLPAVVVGGLLAERIKAHLFSPIPVLAALVVGGVVMIAVGGRGRRPHPPDGRSEDEHVELEALTWRGALVIGLLQCFALWPGMSRSMVTILGAMLVGMRPRQAAEFSFLLGVLTLTSATAYDAVRNMLGDGPNMAEVLGAGPILVGMSVAAISAALTVQWLVGFLNRQGLRPFGWYRLALAAVMAVFIWQGWVEIAPQA